MLTSHTDDQTLESGSPEPQPLSLTLLIADDSSSDRLILKAIVQAQGHRFIEAIDGEDAVAKFVQGKPDIVLLDAIMPRLDGFEAARQIKQLAGEDNVPIIFLTALNDAESLAKCVSVGGDDFLSKPYNPIILQAKIKAFDRMRRMHKTLQRQRDQISESNKQLLREQYVAKSVFDNVAHRGCLEARNIRYLISPLSIFNGDVLLACQKPSGDLHILLGDFTGHGLSAAIGAMPLAELFYGMTAKGYSLRNIVSELNQKLTFILPDGFFCCACLLALKFELNEIETWMGGLPDSFLLRGDQLLRVKSNHLPLGILKTESFDPSTYLLEMNRGDRFYMWSDGIVETTNSDGSFYGDERLAALVSQHISADDLFARIKQDVLDFSGDSKPTDDLTMLELTMMSEQELGITKPAQALATRRGPKRWELTYRLQDDSLANFDPVPLLLQMIVEVPGLRRHSGQVFTIISELYNNALDHGVLGLESALKSSPDGFARYYQVREERCQQLCEGYIHIHITHADDGKGGLLRLRFEDSGAGFDYQAKLAAIDAVTSAGVSAAANNYSGRGLSLLKNLCTRMEFEGVGNIIEVDFEWCG